MTGPAGMMAEVNEGPQFWTHGNRAIITYSGSDCSTDQYAIGYIYHELGGDYLTGWTKNPASPDNMPHPDGTNPVIYTNVAGSVFATGHNGFFKSPDGCQDWIVFHANPGANEGCGTDRAAHIQPFNWTAANFPNFVVYGDAPAIPLDAAIPKPAGSPFPPSPVTAPVPAAPPSPPGGVPPPGTANGR